MALDPNCARNYGKCFEWELQRKTNIAESEVECFSGVKTAQNSKAEGGIERKKHENVKLKEKNHKNGP